MRYNSEATVMDIDLRVNEIVNIDKGIKMLKQKEIDYIVFSGDFVMVSLDFFNEMQNRCKEFSN